MFLKVYVIIGLSSWRSKVQYLCRYASIMGMVFFSMAANTADFFLETNWLEISDDDRNFDLCRGNPPLNRV